jgi:hypothetical protein
VLNGGANHRSLSNVRLINSAISSARCNNVMGLRARLWTPAMGGNCEYIEYAAADKEQSVVLQLGGWAWG